MRIGKFIGALLFVALLASPTVIRGEDEDTFPQIFTANVIAMNAPRATTGRLRMTVERWSTPEDRQRLGQARLEGGTPGLVKIMEGVTMGYLQAEDSLRWPIRVASTYESPEGRVVRLATNRPVHIFESQRGTRSLDYPIGIIQFVLPPDGKPGQGTLLGATQVKINDAGQLEVTSMPHNTGAQTLNNIRMPKPKKGKKDKKGKD